MRAVGEERMLGKDRKDSVRPEEKEGKICFVWVTSHSSGHFFKH